MPRSWNDELQLLPRFIGVLQSELGVHVGPSQVGDGFFVVPLVGGAAAETSAFSSAREDRVEV